MLNFWLEKIINKDQLKRREREIRFINNEKSKLREGEESHHMNKQIFLGRGFFTLLLVDDIGENGCFFPQLAAIICSTQFGCW